MTANSGKVHNTLLNKINNDLIKIIQEYNLIDYNWKEKNYNKQELQRKTFNIWYELISKKIYLDFLTIKRNKKYGHWAIPYIGEEYF